MTSTVKGIWFVVLGSIVTSSYGIWSKVLGDTFEPLYQGYVRSLLICLIVLPILWYKKEIIPIRRQDWKWMTVYIIATSATSAPIYYAFTHMDIGSAYLLFFVGMLLTMAMIGFVSFREKMTEIKVLAFILALIGLYITFSFSAATFTILAAAMALLNGIASGTEVAISKKSAGYYSSSYLVFLSFVAVCVTNGIISALVGENTTNSVSGFSWLYMALFAISSLLGYWLLLKGIQYLESTIGGLLSPLEAIFGILFGVLIFHEVLTGRMITGGTMIIIAAALPHVADLYRQKRRDTA